VNEESAEAIVPEREGLNLRAGNRVFTSVKVMLNVEKHRTIQIQLPKEAQWAECSVSVADAGVPVISSDTVSRKWLSDCEKERALTVRHMERVADLANLEIACRRVISNKGSGGVDAMTVSELGNWFSGHWKELQQQLLSGSYRPQPVKTVVIPKPSGGQRMLGVPTVKDRLVQQAIHCRLSHSPSVNFPRYSPT
jgi:RNA-directed DNA polymerase